jgi:tRNA (guanine26-N2/guanine27-N2)-dimethyltransferase
VKEFQEGKAVFKADLSGKDKGPGKARGVFYNPAMRLSRDLHVAFAKQFDFSGIMLDGLAASGIRGIRLNLEAGVNVEFCDKSRIATEAIADNLKMNGIESKIYNKRVEDLLQDKKYDWIDIDPFGTPAPYLEAALKGLDDGGVLGVAATDTAVLCGAKPSVCKRRYGAVTMRKVAAKEVGVRILLSRIHKIASEIDKGIEPLLCYSEGHHLRVFVRLGEKKDISLKWITKNMRIVDREEKDAGGPLWVSKIIKADLVPVIERDPNLKRSGEFKNQTLWRLLETLREEADGPPGLHDINDIAKSAGIGQTPQRIKIVESIRRLGFFASSSVFSPLGIKTDASEDIRNQAVKLAQSL